MKKQLTILALFAASLTQAQNIGINSTGAAPNASAVLDVDAAPGNDKGMLMPRLALVATNNPSPVTLPATSLLVYNTATASTGTTAVSPGYYYWDGVVWVRLQTSATAVIDWNLLGNTGTNPTTNFLGTIDAQALVLRTSNVERMRVNSNGNVGIGINNPTQRLDVLGDCIFRNIGTVPTGAIWRGTSNVDGVEIGSGGPGDSYLTVQRSGPGDYPFHVSRGAVSSPNDGLIGFYRTNTLIGAIVYPNAASVAYNTTSDIRLKENVKTSNYGITDLLKIEVKDYNYIMDETKTTQNGFIAQQLHTIYPQAVLVGGEDAKTEPWMIDYGKLTPLLVKAMQDQQKQMQQQQSQVEELKKQLADVIELLKKK